MLANELAALLRKRFPETLVARGEVTVTVEPGELLATLEYLRDDPLLSFGFLADVTATDWPEMQPRFWMAYHLRSMEHHHRVRVKAGLQGDEPHVATATGLFPTANWLEREVFDFFGVTFDGHPDLRRIELPEDWEGHPLRKDHSLGGVNTQYKGHLIEPPDVRGGP